MLSSIHTIDSFSGNGFRQTSADKAALHDIATATWSFPVLGEKSLVLTKAWVTYPSNKGQ